MLNVILIGDSNVGKSSLLYRFTDNTEPTVPIFDLSFDFKTRTINISKYAIKLAIWDFLGHDRFRTRTSSFYRGVHGIIVVFDITNQESYNSAKVSLKEMERFVDKDVSKLLVGNKCDLDEKRSVPQEAAQKFAEDLQIPYMETTAKYATNVEGIFKRITKDILLRRRECTK